MSKTIKNEAPETEVEVQVETPAELVARLGGVSKAIRALAADPEYQNEDGTANRGKIAKAVDKRYQHVRNVLLQPLKKS